MRMLAFGTYDVTRQPRVGVLIEGLRANGVDVVEVNEPLGFTTADRVTMAHRPWLSYRLLMRVLTRWAALARHSRGLDHFDAVLVGYLGQLDVLLARVLFPRRRIILDMLIFGADTARDRGVTSRMTLALLDALDRIAIKAADVVLVDTDESVTLVPARHRHKVVVVPVGASYYWFRARRESRATSGGLKVVFFGLYTPLHGATVIGAALARLRDRTDVVVTMIGDGQDLAAARAAAGGREATWLDWVDPQALPDLIARHDVCLGIFGATPKALRVVPNKIFQGAAAGCAIITSDTPAQRRLLGASALYIPPGDSAALGDALVTLADEPDTCLRMQALAAQTAHSFAPESIVRRWLTDVQSWG